MNREKNGDIEKEKLILEKTREEKISSDQMGWVQDQPRKGRGAVHSDREKCRHMGRNEDKLITLIIKLYDSSRLLLFPSLKAKSLAESEEGHIRSDKKIYVIVVL